MTTTHAVELQPPQPRLINRLLIKRGWEGWIVRGRTLLAALTF